MDDDLSSLRGSSTPPDDDFLSSFGASSDAPSSSSSAAGSGSLDLFDSPAPAPAAAKSGAKAKPAGKKKKKATKKRSGLFLGMGPMERMVLSVFLFLDVSVLGCLILVALGKINLIQ